MAIRWHASSRDAIQDLVGACRVWEGFTLHHTATRPNGKHQAKAIDHWHRFGRGWFAGMGYHFLIEEDGMIAVGNRWRKQLNGAHEKGYNHTHIGISLVGWFDRGKDIPTLAQIYSLVFLARGLASQLAWSSNLIPMASGGAIVRYHCDSAPKTCPGELWHPHRIDLIAAIITPDPLEGAEKLHAILTEEAQL